jgi:hypothetical protein
LNEEKKQQVIALGRLGWSLRRIQRAIGVRRETAATYLKAAGIEHEHGAGAVLVEPVAEGRCILLVAQYPVLLL